MPSMNKGGEGKVSMDRVVVQRIGCIFVLNGWIDERIRNER